MDREKVIAWLADEELYYREHGDTHNSLMACDALALLKEQKVKTGHWIQSNPKFVSAKATGGSRMSTCSNCGKWGRKSFSFCPHCGAKMKGR